MKQKKIKYQTLDIFLQLFYSDKFRVNYHDLKSPRRLYDYIEVSYFVISALKSSKVVEKDRKPPTPSQLTQAAKLDHYLTMQLLQECIGPRLSQEVSV